MTWILTHIKLVGILAVLSYGGYLGYSFEKTRIANMLKAQETLLTNQCNNDKEITSHASKTYQDKILGLSKQLSDIKRLHPARCVQTTSSPSTRPNGSPIAGQHADTNAVSSGWLFDFAYECEGYRQRLIGLQGFVTTVWARK